MTRFLTSAIFVAAVIASGASRAAGPDMEGTPVSTSTMASAEIPPLLGQTQEMKDLAWLAGRWPAASEKYVRITRHPGSTDDSFVLIREASTDNGTTWRKSAEYDYTRKVESAGHEGSEGQAMRQEIRRAMESHFDRGKKLVEMGQFKRAEIEFQLVLELDHQYPGASDLLKRCREGVSRASAEKLAAADAARADGRLDMELKALRGVLVFDPSNEAALTGMRKALERIPAEKRRLLKAGLEWDAKGESRKALVLLDQAHELDPDDIGIESARLAALAKAGKP